MDRGRSSRFQPSLKGRSTRQTASTRVGELSIRYMRPFRTSPTDIYSYGTTIHMSILSSRFRTDTTNAIDEFTADSRGFTKSSRGYTRMYGGFADGFTNGFATDSREFARVRESSREFARVREGYADGFTTDIRRIPGLTHIRERIHSDVHKGSYTMFTVHRCESVYGI